MTIDTTNMDTYRELRTFVKPANLHGAIDELLGVLGAWSVKIEPLYEAHFPEADGELDLDQPVSEYILTATFGEGLSDAASPETAQERSDS